MANRQRSLGQQASFSRIASSNLSSLSSFKSLVLIIIYITIYYNTMSSQLPLQDLVPRFIERLLSLSERKTTELQELQIKPSKICSSKFTLGLMRSLELEEEVVLAGLIMAKMAVDAGLKVGKRALNRLLTLCVMLAEKCYSEEQNSVEVYSLATGVPIKEINLLELKLMTLLDYRLVIRQREFELMAKGDLNTLFSERVPNN